MIARLPAACISAPTIAMNANSMAGNDAIYGGAGTDLIRADSGDVLNTCEGVWPA